MMRVMLYELLARVIGVGTETADMLVQEVLSRNMRDRRAVARAIGVRAGYRRRNRTWSAILDLRDRFDDALEDFLERHCLIVVVADVHRMAAGVDRVGGQRGREAIPA